MTNAITTLHLSRYFLAILTSFLVTTHAPAAINKTGEVNYDIHVQIDPDTRSLKGHSLITVKNATELRLILGQRFEVTHALIEGVPLESSKNNLGSPYHSWIIPFSLGVTHHIEIHWRGELSPLNTSLDHQATLGRPIPVSSAEGTFLPKSSGWYPHIIGALASYRVNLKLPAGQRGLVAGKLTDESDSAQGYEASFEFPLPSEGIDLMAGPYQIVTDHMTAKDGREIQLRTYFHPQINHLADGYLEAVKDYFKLYETWIGDYPFTEFSVVSSPTPTGFGMPTLTYLGINVLRLPFIRATSLGHEVLHNWWGNGVYPDYSQGNWSEGLTTFMADYAYKEHESDEAAREMRLGWLRDFSALSPGQDAPLNTFTSRTHGASKIVGYNKTAMLFFMLRDQLGTEIFDRSIQAFWNIQRFKITTWQDLQSIFEMVSVSDLEPFFDQWLNRSGAPAINLLDVSKTKLDEGFQVTVTLKQSLPTYQLRVPIIIYSANDEQTQILDLQQEQQTFTFNVQSRPLKVALDPNLHLFRQLAPDEAPPILREVMVNQTTTTLLLAEKGETLEIAKILAKQLQRRPATMIGINQSLPAKPILVIGLQQQIDTWLATHHLPERPEIIKDKGSAQAWTLRRTNGATLVIVSAQDNDSLAALIRPLPHYGRQSYIVFEDAKAIERGTWPMKVQMMAIE
jgi:aminopeptidase N